LAGRRERGRERGRGRERRRERVREGPDSNGYAERAIGAVGGK
jgi:hypothetical protein